MKRWFNCFIVLLSLLVASSSDAGVKRGISATAGTARVQKNLVTNYGATCNGVADDTSAFLAFKAAFQGGPAVQLNMPAGTCTYSGAGAALWPFRGIPDLIVNGAGSGSTTFKTIGGLALFGGAGQTQDSSHSLRTTAATAGDSCVTIKTQPAVTVSDAANSLPVPDTFTASVPASGVFVGGQSGTTLTVASVTSGSVQIGAYVDSVTFIVSQSSGTPNGAGGYVVNTGTNAGNRPPGSSITGTGNILIVTAVASGAVTLNTYISNSNSNISGFTFPQSQLTGTTGGVGNYQLNAYQTVTMNSQKFTSAPASFTASVDANGIMTVSAITEGAIAIGMFVYSADGVASAVAVKSQLTGTTGSTGTYQLAHYVSATGAPSQAFQGNGQIRVTLNSTAGLTTGDTLFLTGISALGALPQRINGLKWIKVVDGTHVDLFQWDFNGVYLSGGTGGGDRTSITSVGGTVMMTGWINQAYWNFPYGFPSNPHWFEYKRVVSTPHAPGDGSHQICFDTPLAYSYSDTWPQYNTGSQFEVDPGGPATIYALSPDFELKHVYQNFDTDQPLNQIVTNGRDVTFQNMAFLGSNCVAPSQNVNHTWLNIAGSLCQIETDKIVVNFNVTNATLRKVNVQSSSFTNINLTNVTANQWFGTGKNLAMVGSSFACVGCSSGGAAVGLAMNYGVADTAVITNTFMGTGTGGSGFTTGGLTQRVNSASHPWSMSGGVITIPNAYSFGGPTDAIGDTSAGETQTRMMAPGGYLFWSGSGGGGTQPQIGRSLKVVSVTQDVDNTYVTTNEAGGFPTGAWTTNGLSLSSHPAPKFTPSGNTGSDATLSFNGCPALAPVNSCQNVTYTGDATGNTPKYYQPFLWGALDTFTFTNNVPYTNAGALTFTLSRFGNWPILKTDLSQVSYGTSPNGEVTINMKAPSVCSPPSACTRTLTTSGATGTQSGDTLTVTPSGALFGGVALSGPIFSAATPSDSPQMTIQLRTNQQLP